MVLRNSHSDNVVKFSLVKLRLNFFLNHSFFWEGFFSFKRLTFVQRSESLERNVDFIRHLELDFKLFGNPITENEPGELAHQDFGEVKHSLSFRADCSFFANRAVEVWYFFRSKESVKGRLEIYVCSFFSVVRTLSSKIKLRLFVSLELNTLAFIALNFCL